jgi:glycosyltransferase involved in cell wall biosynthesis
MDVSMNIGAVIPAYNVGNVLPAVLSKVLNYIPCQNVYVIDDGSSDHTAEVAKNNNVILFQHEINKGKGEALRSGFRMALSDMLDGVFTLDGDSQHNPDDIPYFISKLENTDSDLVIGTRHFKIGNMPIDRIFSNRCSSYIVSKLSHKNISDSQCGFRLIKREVLTSIKLTTSHYETETELLVKAIWKGFKISNCDISTNYDNYLSHIRRFTDTKRFCKLILQLLKENNK